MKSKTKWYTSMFGGHCLTGDVRPGSGGGNGGSGREALQQRIERSLVRDYGRFSQNLKGQTWRPKQNHRQSCCASIISRSEKTNSKQESLKNI